MAVSKRLKQTVGKSFYATLAETLLTDPYEVFKELGSNSHDADASEVHFSYNPTLDELIIEDNGTGMNQSGIDSFFREGDSEKLGVEQTALGRSPIGKFGIATILLESLADNVLLETWNDGKKITVDVDLAKEITPDTEETYTIAVDKKHSSGTKLTLRNLKISPQVNFKLSRLRHALRWEMPYNVENFAMFVNGSKIERPTPDPHLSFDYQVDVPNVGMVDMHFDYFKRKQPKSGVYCVIRNRPIPEPLQLAKKAMTQIGPNLYGEVHAPGLHDEIVFDRSTLMDSDLVAAVITATNAKLRLVHEAVVSERQSNLVGQYSENVIPNALIELSNDATKKGAIGITSHQGDLSIASAGVSLGEHEEAEKFRPLEYVVETNYAGDNLGKIRERTVVINGSHPLTSLHDKKPNPADVKARLHIAATEIRSRKVLTNSGSSKYDKRDTLIAELAGLLFEEKSTFASLMEASQDAWGKINPNRLYDDEEVRDTLGVDDITLESFYESGVATRHPSGSLVGTNLISAQKVFDGFVTAESTVRAREVMSIDKIDLAELEEKLMPYADDISYLTNIGGNKPFHLVQAGFEQTFWSLVSGGWLDKPIEEIPFQLSGYGDEDVARYVSLPQAGTIMGLSLTDLLSTFDKAIKIGKTVRSNGSNYNLDDLGEVMQYDK